MEYFVSFCIPEYNNSDAAYQLVTQLLENPDRRFQVVISDNASVDDTVERLKTIGDSRLKICRNPVNLGAKPNWCNALEQGDGEWLYLVMGRDKLDACKIGRLIDMLSLCGKKNIGCAVDRQTPGGIRFMNLYESVEYLLRFGEHPTGAIFLREAFLDTKGRKKYFRLAFTYPEVYIKRDILAMGYDGAIISANVYTGEVNIDKTKVKSQYEENKEILYWYPQRQTEQFIHIIRMIEYDNKFSFNRKQYDSLYLANWKQLTSRVSLGWKNHNEDPVWTAHYNRICREISTSEMLRNIISAYKAVMCFCRKEKWEMRFKRRMLMLYETCSMLIRIGLRKYP